MRKLPKNFPKGQTVLIILLIMAVILTIGLSVISTSITDIKISQETEEASRAFYVAESALEESLMSPLDPLPAGLISGIKYGVSKVDQGGQEFLFPSGIESGQPQIVWLVGHKKDGSLDTSQSYRGKVNLFWGNQNSSENPALMVSLIYKEGGNYKVVRKNYDPDGTRRSKNKFDSAVTGSYTVSGENLKHSALFEFEVPATAQPYFLKLTQIYNTSPQFAGVKVPSGSLPSQGTCFESTATVEASNITRKIKQCKLWQGVPEIFMWGLFSGSNEKGLVKEE